ncbi:hypothetical protein QQY66_03595 [Streptomyces sp. DG2A-72]|uniref:hypothetical protein n=1 Tax=Streptomyces sp. DG2A-72 TaxID=3051386 RepID=UPI00265B818A|nr:hypothetical protein [Streptomyces sp. DG2A-72]MDO0930802.1 hypothetical protein [Streptomyces sp. DG2A-72]
MSLPYIRQGEVCIVPVVRHHLTFAVQVQRAVHELGLGRQDLVAVGLPESVRGPMLQAVKAIPRVSLVVSRVRDSDQHEVFPVTPADGMVEAVRIATERDIPLALVDQEMAPGHLLDRFCMADEEWPDDGLALEHGAEWYLALIAERLARPPSRFEPVDTWRELHMAARLQALYPRYRRILFVCNATHVAAVRRLLTQPALTIEGGPSLPDAQYDIRQPSLPILLRYLDHIPRLVQRYEEYRKENRAHTFDKHEALLELIHQLSEEATDLKLSIRHYQVFSQVLTKLLEEEQRISPSFEAILTACQACFNKPFKERVYRSLLGYHDQVRVERIGRIRSTRETLFELATTTPRNHRGPVFVARNCGQYEQFFEVLGATRAEWDEEASGLSADLLPLETVDLGPSTPPPAPSPRLNRWPQGWESSTWPPTDEFLEEVRRKAFDLARTQDDRQMKSMEFQGALHNGLDFRRTLRSHYKGQPKLYVRQERRSQRFVADHAEPMVWLSDAYESGDLSDPSHMMEYILAGTEPEPTLVAEWFCGKRLDLPQRDYKNRYGEPVKVSAWDIHGRANFNGWVLTMEEIRNQLGDDLTSRMPQHATLLNLDLHSLRLPGVQGPELDWGRWWEVLLAVALQYAKEAILLIAPHHFVVPAHINAQAAASGKRIAHISTAGFTREELRKMGIAYFLEHRYPKKRLDANDPVHRAYLVDRFSDVMKQFWG